MIPLFPPVPMPAWLFATVHAFLEPLLGASDREPGVAHFAHPAGMLGALVLALHWEHEVRALRVHRTLTEPASER